MATCARMVQLLKSLNVQLGKLHVSPQGVRHIHLGAATRSREMLNNSAPLNTPLAQTCCPQIVLSGINGSSSIVPHRMRGLGENIEINRNEKSKIKYETPKIPGLDKDIETPSTEGSYNKILDIPDKKDKIDESPLSKLPSLELKQKMRNRRKKQHDTIVRHIKMKRHQLRRVRKRLWPIKRKEKFLRRKKRERRFLWAMEQKKDLGRNFDAEEYVKDWLEKAKKAGYRYNYRPLINAVRDPNHPHNKEK